MRRQVISCASYRFQPRKQILQSKKKRKAKQKHQNTRGLFPQLRLGPSTESQRFSPAASLFVLQLRRFSCQGHVRFGGYDTGHATTREGRKRACTRLNWKRISPALPTGRDGENQESASSGFGGDLPWKREREKVPCPLASFSADLRRASAALFSFLFTACVT